MEIISLNCDGCGSPIKVNEGETHVKCQVCGKEMLIDDGTRKIKVVDEAKALENKLRLERLMKKKAADAAHNEMVRVQKKKRWIWRIISIICHIVFFLIILSMIRVANDESGAAMKIIPVFLGYFLFVPIILSVTRPMLDTDGENPADTSKVKNTVLTWVLYIGILFIAAIIAAVTME